MEHGAGINTHSNEFKESALTLACYKGHLDMVRFLLEAGADQEHKTDEMHTALMEASMDGHVEVARLLLDSGAQVNMPTDSFESPLTLAACGGHVDLAMLLIERGANIEEVNDEGYTPLMEASREGHEEMAALLLSQGKSNITVLAGFGRDRDRDMTTKVFQSDVYVLVYTFRGQHKCSNGGDSRDRVDTCLLWWFLRGGRLSSEKWC